MKNAENAKNLVNLLINGKKDEAVSLYEEKGVKEEFTSMLSVLQTFAEEQAAKAAAAKKAELTKLFEDLPEELKAQFKAELGLVQGKASKAIKTKTAKERVKVKFENKTYDMPVKGNMNQELKDLVSNSGLERADFIEKYRV